MELGDLEFKGRDCFRAHRESQDLVIPGEVDSWDALAIILNRILREKLAKEPEMNCRLVGEAWEADECSYLVNRTHRARLVCINEIGK